MQTARDFLSILERDYHLDFSGSRGSSVETLLRQFVAANRVEARDQGQALMATANANLLHELQAKDKTVAQLAEANDKSAEERDMARLEALHLKQETDALKSEIAAIHSVADKSQEVGDLGYGVSCDAPNHPDGCDCAARLAKLKEEN